MLYQIKQRKLLRTAWLILFAEWDVLVRSIHDQGRNFESELIKQLCDLLQIEKTRTTPYHPQSDGLVERFNHTLIQMLSMYVNENTDNWDDCLPFAMMAYRASVHESTNMTPNKLMMGRETNVPIDLMVGQPPHHGQGSPKCPVEYVNWVRAASEDAYEY